MAPRQDSLQDSPDEHTRLRQRCIDELPDNPHIKLSVGERTAIKAHMSVMARHVLKKGAKQPDDATKLLILSVELYAVAKSLAQSETSSSTEFRADFERLEQELGDLMSVLTQFVDYKDGPKTSAIVTEMTWNRFGNIKKLFKPDGVLNQLLADLSGGSVHLDAPLAGRGTLADSEGFLAGLEPLAEESVADSVRKMETALQTNLAGIRAESRKSAVDQVEYLMEAFMHRVNLFVLKHHEACVKIDAEKANELLNISTELSTLMETTNHKALQLRSNPTQNRSAKAGLSYQIGVLTALANESHSSELNSDPIPVASSAVEEVAVADDVFNEEEIQALHKLTAKYLLQVAKDTATVRGHRESIVAAELRSSQPSFSDDEVLSTEIEAESPTKSDSSESWFTSIYSLTIGAAEENSNTGSPKSESSDSSSWSLGSIFSSSEQRAEATFEDTYILGALARSAGELADTVGEFGQRVLDSITPEELFENINKHYREIVSDLLPEVEPELARELVIQVSNKEEADQELDPNIKIVLENFYQILSKDPQDWSQEDINSLKEDNEYLSEMDDAPRELLESVDILSNAAVRIHKAILKEKTASKMSSTSTPTDSMKTVMQLLAAEEPEQKKLKTCKPVEPEQAAKEKKAHKRSFLPKSLHLHVHMPNFTKPRKHPKTDVEQQKKMKEQLIEVEEVPIERSSKFKL